MWTGLPSSIVPTVINPCSRYNEHLAISSQKRQKTESSTDFRGGATRSHVISLLISPTPPFSHSSSFYKPHLHPPNTSTAPEYILISTQPPKTSHYHLKTNLRVLPSSSISTLLNPPTTMPPATTEPKKWNTTSAAKDAGHTSFPNFLLSYGLRIYNPDDVEEGKAILRGMGYAVS